MTALAGYAKVALLLAVLSATAVNAQSARQGEDTTGKQIEHARGFTFGSNVAGYLRLSTDVCDIKAAIGPDNTANYEAAAKIYSDGKNSFKSDGTQRAFQEIATAPYRGEPTWDKYAKYYGTPDFLDTEIAAAFAGEHPYTSIAQRNETIVKGVESLIQTVYLLHEVDEAAGKIRNKSLSAATGAPHNVDETWAIWVGERPDCSLWGLAYRRGKEFGTLVDCDNSKVNIGMLNAHKAMYEAAEAGDLAAFNAQRTEAIRLFMIVGIQNALKYAQLMDAARARNEPEVVEAEQTEGYAYFRTIEPLVAAADPTAAATIRKVFYPGNPAPANALTTVRTAVQKIYPEYDITSADIGSFGASVPADCLPAAIKANAVTNGASGSSSTSSSGDGAAKGSATVTTAGRGAIALVAAVAAAALGRL
eukprot:GHUV01000021.1.p1 GENE.GHUV01000021.1~~GHUV01000021.1.p1  ORF type:complete len:420 (+),score=129.51 GHUV01000021.1:221-1480(+)